MNEMRLVRIFFLILLLCSGTTSLFAQREYSTSVEKAIRFFEIATKYYDGRQNEKAIDALKTALEADPKFSEAWSLQGNIYEDMREYEKAVASYKKAVEVNPDLFPNNYFALGTNEFKLALYPDAKAHFEKFISYPKVKPFLATRAKQMIANCDFSINAMLNPVPFQPVNMGDSINTSDHEYFPAITADGKTFLFTRRLVTTNAVGKPSQQEDFYISHFVNNAWSKAMPITEINTGGNEGAPCLSPDGQYLFFIGCEELSERTSSRKTNGSCDIFLSKKVGDKFTTPRNLEAPINTAAWETTPSFSSDGRTLYFVRGTTGKDGRKQRDIYMSRIGDNSEWTEPVPLSDKINTSGDEISVFMHPDDQTLYFSSDGLPGMGGQDIFMSRRQEDGSWGDPVNLGYPINTSNDENSFLVGPTGDIGFIASNREGGKGGMDLYQFPLYEKARPQMVTYMKGKVFDYETKKMLGASFDLIDLSTGKTVVSSTSNTVNGEFLVCLPSGRSYALNVSKDGYLFYSDNFQLKDPASSKAPVMKDIALKPIRTGESIVLNNVFFEFNKFDLKDESHVELGKVISFMKKNPSVHVEISGHTDNVGGKQYNQTLSEKRSRSVYDYLVQNGLSADRLSYKGYGDSKPIAENTTEQGRAKNRRTEFMVTGN